MILPGRPGWPALNLFPQIGTLREHNNVFYVQVVPDLVNASHIVCKIPPKE